MKEINEAFSTLRGILPSFTARRSSTSGMTKITTLKLATSYIQALSDVLSDVEAPPGSAPFKALPKTSSSSPFLDEHHQSYGYPGSRASLSSSSEIGDLLSDDSCVFEGNLDAFDDIPALPEQDPFALLLAGDTSGDIL
ncbi:UNVERIFIED_CONTAM: hypothetical protein GTU68_013474 [Idotea baltica]|nr:hypothetical protein [Idotea baltica]